MDRGIDIPEVPFVRGNLPVGVEIPLAQHEFQLLFGEIRIDDTQGNSVKSQVPAAYPGYSHLSGMEMISSFTHVEPLGLRIKPRWSTLELRAVFHEPGFQIIYVVLLGPEHARQGLPHNETFIITETYRCYRVVKVVSLFLSAGVYFVEIDERLTHYVRSPVGQSQLYLGGSTTSQSNPVIRSGLVTEASGLRHLFQPLTI